MTECLFCELNDLTRRAVLNETGDFRLILDPFPISHGHIIIVPKRHVDKIDSLNQEEFSKLQEMISKAKDLASRDSLDRKYEKILSNSASRKSEKLIEEVIRNKQKPDGFNIGVNEGEAAGQTIKHLHIHLIPRYDGDVENPEGGIRKVIPDRADYTD